MSLTFSTRIYARAKVNRPIPCVKQKRLGPVPIQLRRQCLLRFHVPYRVPSSKAAWQNPFTISKYE